MALRAAQYPASIPVNLVSLSLIQSAMTSVADSIGEFFKKLDNIFGQVKTIRSLYEIKNIPNIIEDGTEPYPENSQTLSAGIAIEFRWVPSLGCNT